MRKIAVAIIALLCAMCAAFAVSYKNNTYQKLAEEYAKKADVALNAGEYDLSEEYAQKAAENALLSKAFIDSMNARYHAQTEIAAAEEKMKWAKSINAEATFPTAYSAGQEALDNAKSAFEREDYESALKSARAVNDALAGAYEVGPLPKLVLCWPFSAVTPLEVLKQFRQGNSF